MTQRRLKRPILAGPVGNVQENWRIIAWLVETLRQPVVAGTLPRSGCDRADVRDRGNLLAGCQKVGYAFCFVLFLSAREFADIGSVSEAVRCIWGDSTRDPHRFTI